MIRITTRTGAGFTFQKWLLYFCLVFTATMVLQDVVRALFGINLSLARTTHYTAAALVALYLTFTSKK
jgi:hypothetical protein